jgi:CheY-like chemotaxis protein
MGCRVLVVEDEIFVAVEIESVVEELGHRPVGIAADATSALSLAREADVAIIDLNLRDGPTGPELGRLLAQSGITVVFITANPSQLGDGIPGTLGVMTKPVSDIDLRLAVSYAVACRMQMPAEPPKRLRLFSADNANRASGEASMIG